MSAPHPTLLSPALLEGAMTIALQRVFQTMTSKTVVTAGSTSLAVSAVPDPEAIAVVGSVGFVGTINGLVHLKITEEFAEVATAAILGMSLPEVRMHGAETIKDAIGELTNMTVGAFKNQLCDLGFRCQLTLPTLLRGKNVVIAAVKASTRHVFQFHCDGYEIVADLQLKLD